MKSKIFYIDSNSNIMKKLSNIRFKIEKVFMFDFLVLYILIPVLFYVLSVLFDTFKVGGISTTIYFVIITIFIVSELIVFCIDYYLYQIIHDSAVIKKGDTITFVHKIDYFDIEENINSKTIHKILDSKPYTYKINEYKNTKLIKETKKYYLFKGLKEDKEVNFKIYKAYSKIENILGKDECNE